MSNKYVKYLVLASIFFSIQCSNDSEFNFSSNYDPEPFVLNVSGNFPDIPVPADNQLTVEGVELGRMLFYDPILSADSTMSCSSCHQQEFSFSDTVSFSLGIDGIEGGRNAMAIINSAWAPVLFWDGRSKDLESQALEPVINPVEMHESWKNAIGKIKKSQFYPELFYKAFGKEQISKKLVAKAISQFERTLISQNSKYDQVLRKEDSFTDKELRGLNLFFTEEADCFHCHGNILFTDMSFHNNGLDSIISDKGLEDFSERKRDRGKFRTPTLRNLDFTAPYMHDGRFASLEEVIDYYSEGVKESDNIDPLMKNVHRGGVQLDAADKSDLIAFLHTLSDSVYITNPKYSNPFPD